MIGLYELIVRRIGLLRAQFGMKSTQREPAQSAFAEAERAQPTL
jgi:hypothetical protein